jgi:hypothetical protein
MRGGAGDSGTGGSSSGTGTTSEIVVSLTSADGAVSFGSLGSDFGGSHLCLDLGEVAGFLELIEAGEREY